MTSAQQQFGMRLRRERESRGISLDAIAASTKIGRALFIGLERGDLSRWPNGVYCRAHVCGYATAIGLSPSDVLAEFNEVYPDRCSDAQSTSAPAVVVTESLGSLRLTFAHQAEPTAETRTKRAGVAAAEALVLAGASMAVSRVTGMDVWMIAAGAAFLYYPLTIASLGETGGFRLLTTIAAAMRGARTPSPAEDAPLTSFAEQPLQALPQPGGMRLQSAAPLSGSMVLDTESTQDRRTPQEYLLH